jgi:hypothetical protein
MSPSSAGILIAYAGRMALFETVVKRTRAQCAVLFITRLRFRFEFSHQACTRSRRQGQARTIDWWGSVHRAAGREPTTGLLALKADPTDTGWMHRSPNCQVCLATVILLVVMYRKRCGDLLRNGDNSVHLYRSSATHHVPTPAQLSSPVA